MIKTLTCLLTLMFASSALAGDTLVFEPVDSQGTPQHIVLVAGDEEYRTEESMPMLGKILSQRHGFKCTVVFSLGADGGYIDANNQQGLKGLEALDSADLMLIGTRFRQPDESGAKHITDFLNAGKPVVGIRTSTHAFRGGGKFGNISFDQFGRKVLGEQWVLADVGQVEADEIFLVPFCTLFRHKHLPGFSDLARRPHGSVWTRYRPDCEAQR